MANNVATSKTCSICGETKTLDDFPKGRRQCKPCRRVYVREYNQSYHAANRDMLLAGMRKRHAANRDERLAFMRDYRRRNYDSQRDAWLSRFNITSADYERILAAQGGGCAICHTPDPGPEGRRFHVDHDHACCPGKTSCGMCVRGILCHHCNVALGNLRDDVALLAKAIDYLNGGRANG